MSELFDHELIRMGSFVLTIGKLASAALIIALAKVLEVVLYNLFIKTIMKQKDLDAARSYSISRIIKYIVYFFALLLILKNFGFQLSAIILGSAGLLVGLGLGLQNTFADLLAGLIILVEGNIAIGDIVVIDGMVGVVKKIKLRTTEIKTRDQVFIIVPNSKLISNNVTNWSHHEAPARFHIDIQIHFKEDFVKVEKILLHAAEQITDICVSPKPQVQLIEFAEYALKVRLYFFSDELFFMEKVLSDLRKRVLTDLQANNVEIPYPFQNVKVIN